MNHALVSFLLAVFAQQAFSLGVTGFSPRSPQSADLKLSDSLEIENVEYSKKDEAPVLPRAYSLAGKEYADVRITAKPLYDGVVSAFKTGRPSAKTAQAPSFKVAAIRKLDSPVRVANAEVEFDGELSVTFGILKISRKTKKGETVYYRLVPPPGFSIVPPKLKAAVREAAIGSYQRACKKQD